MSLPQLYDTRGDRVAIRFDAWQIDRICVDYRLELCFLYPPSDGSMTGDELIAAGLTEVNGLGGPAGLHRPFVLGISCETCLEFPGGRRHCADPEGPREQLAPFLGLFTAEVRSMVAHLDGRLEIAFDDGRRLTCTPDRTYEAWTLVGPGDLQIVCGIGDEGLYVFPGEWPTG